MNKATYHQQAYRKVQIEMAQPGRVLLSLYDEAHRLIRLAEQQIADGDLSGKGRSLGKAHAIIAEFINALDHKMAPELCLNLERIYLFMLDRITAANLDMDAAPLGPVIANLSRLRETWELAVNTVAVENSRAAAEHAAEHP
ncbi:MAG: flagellar export chaperone FliS [Deltaproteobacteria bacterium]|nr:flagellar export chaperone FliS [Deltaproteobacteria bacterium]